MPEKEIELKSICGIDNYKFIIPNYQRGYKWREKDVEYLIKDIAEIVDEDQSDYCLQPIVVAKYGDSYILVDGQQRLTTIWLIINWAAHNNFNVEWNYKITYEQRPRSNVFLKKVHDSGFGEDLGTCDTHYFSQAIDVIAQKKDLLNVFFDNLNKHVKIIWYQISAQEGPAHFERLNNARIGLTNAELVKAFIMTNSSSEIRARMACEWDEMEYKLQDKSFFSFITPKNSIYSNDNNRIELLLDLYSGTTKSDREKDEYFTFNRIANNTEKDSIVIWREIQNIYNRLLCWYEDNFLYNLIGFLVEINGDGELSSIWNDSKGKSTNEIKEIVRERVIKWVPSEDEIREMEYKDGMTKNTLLLFNILSYMSVLPTPKHNEYKFFFNDKFPFDLYKKESWDKEHVHATASQSLQSKPEWINWLKDIDEKLVEDKMDSENSRKMEYIEWIQNAQKVTQEDYESIKNDSNAVFKSLSKEYFNKMFIEIVSAIEGSNEDYELKQNSIGNLVLLSANINRSGEYKVAPFSTKRKIIIERIMSGQFVPIGTKNVFMKVYTPHPGHFYKWEKDKPYDGNQKSDRDNYIDAIITTINRLR